MVRVFSPGEYNGGPSDPCAALSCNEAPEKGIIVFQRNFDSFHRYENPQFVITLDYPPMGAVGISIAIFLKGVGCLGSELFWKLLIEGF
jgi:hypothetical protein